LINNRDFRRDGGLALHFGLGGSVGGGLASCPDGWRKRDADGAQGETSGGTGSGASDEALAVVLELLSLRDREILI
jgi:hypothetical protein